MCVCLRGRWANASCLGSGTGKRSALRKACRKVPAVTQLVLLPSLKWSGAGYKPLALLCANSQEVILVSLTHTSLLWSPCITTWWRPARSKPKDTCCLFLLCTAICSLHSPEGGYKITCALGRRTVCFVVHRCQGAGVFSQHVQETALFRNEAAWVRCV